MYLAMIVLLLFVLPIASIAIEHFADPGALSLLALVGRWFVFWAVGVRLFLAGIRQTLNPTFTAKTIFGIKDPAAEKIVQELGFGNLSIGLLGLVSLFFAPWVIPAAIAGGLFYLLAGIKHVLNGERNRTETIALITDLIIGILLAGYLVGVFLAAR